MIPAFLLRYSAVFLSLPHRLRPTGFQSFSSAVIRDNCVVSNTSELHFCFRRKFDVVTTRGLAADIFDHCTMKKHIFARYGEVNGGKDDKSVNLACRLPIQYGFRHLCSNR
jgi:hypothetical protein